MTTKAPKKLTEYTAELIDRYISLGDVMSYWLGTRWCPAVSRDGDGYSVRIGTQTYNGWKFDYFRTDADGVIQSSPRGYARDYNRKARITDVAEVAERMSTPDPSAHRFRFGF